MNKFITFPASGIMIR